ncbi:uncharacterized protein BDZ99DRAFT_55382 [Mytilinidion resinicola]|uniref:Uncharacterized protein n=1 Tax=Mytilinidion resinicola TaxID=574789 RepID=A0A6A6YKC4_9PEZI|nr:uncharacterized protein BDZ99DRAFT_55382 [Mytilinidion resinicola]KAF2808424.1 hypothetical protein BDZ99DRAFT_55382 [Mytilinidion resinicola]
MRTHTRFQPLRTPSLRRLRTAFSPTREPRPREPLSASSTSSTRTTSPLTRTSSPDSHFSASSTASSLRALLLLRRKPSSLDLEMEEERRSFGVELDMLEPRPHGEARGMGGIFEVLDGRV